MLAALSSVVSEPPIRAPSGSTTHEAPKNWRWDVTAERATRFRLQVSPSCRPVRVACAVLAAPCLLQWGLVGGLGAVVRCCVRWRVLPVSCLDSGSCLVRERTHPLPAPNKNPHAFSPHFIALLLDAQEFTGGNKGRCVRTLEPIKKGKWICEVHCRALNCSFPPAFSLPLARTRRA